MTPAGNRCNARFALVTVFAGLIGLACLLSGCNDAQSGALIGAGIGALAGQAIGGDTEGPVIGTAVGAGMGYMIGNESDKANQYNGNYHY